MMEYIENRLTYDDYVMLRSSVGWSNFSEEQAMKCVENSLYDIMVIKDNCTCGCNKKEWLRSKVVWAIE